MRRQGPGAGRSAARRVAARRQTSGAKSSPGVTIGRIMAPADWRVNGEPPSQMPALYSPRGRNVTWRQGRRVGFFAVRDGPLVAPRVVSANVGGSLGMVSTSLGGNGHGGTAVLEPTAPAYREQNARDHVWIHQAPWVDLAENDGLYVFDRGEGSTLYDVRGRAYIDGISGLWVVNAGHGR